MDLPAWQIKCSCAHGRGKNHCKSATKMQSAKQGPGNQVLHPNDNTCAVPAASTSRAAWQSGNLARASSTSGMKPLTSHLCYERDAWNATACLIHFIAHVPAIARLTPLIQPSDIQHDPSPGPKTHLVSSSASDSKPDRCWISATCLNLKRSPDLGHLDAVKHRCKLIWQP